MEFHKELKLHWIIEIIYWITYWITICFPQSNLWEIWQAEIFIYFINSFICMLVASKNKSDIKMFFSRTIYFRERNYSSALEIILIKKKKEQRE